MREPENTLTNSSARRLYSHTSYISSHKFSFKQVPNPRLTLRESFFLEFASEIDIFSREEHFPDWVLRFREEILCKIGKNFRKICHSLKSRGIEFLIKFPVEIEGKWRFADFYFPKLGLVAVILSVKDTMYHPCCMETDKERWFAMKYRVIAIYPREVDKLLEALGV